MMITIISLLIQTFFNINEVLEAKENHFGNLYLDVASLNKQFIKFN